LATGVPTVMSSWPLYRLNNSWNAVTNVMNGVIPLS
jgi:hypothetical protein